MALPSTPPRPTHPASTWAPARPPREPQDRGYTPIHAAVVKGDLAALRAALAAIDLSQKAAVVNEKSLPDSISTGLTALEMAAQSFFQSTTPEESAKYRAIMEELLAAGADIRVITNDKSLFTIAAATKKLVVSLFKHETYDAGIPDETSEDIELLHVLKIRAATLSADERRALLNQRVPMFRNMEEYYYVENASAFLVAICNNKPQTASVLLDMMDESTRADENANATALCGELFTHLTTTFSALTPAMNPGNVRVSVNMIQNDLQRMLLLMQYGVDHRPFTGSDLFAGYEALLARLPDSSEKAAQCAAIHAAFTYIATYTASAPVIAAAGSIAIVGSPAVPPLHHLTPEQFALMFSGFKA